MIDHIKKYTTKNIDNVHSLEYMANGLNLLANTIKDLENKIKEKPIMQGCIFYMGSRGIPTKEIYCYYMWFSNTLVNYVQLVGTLAIMEMKGWGISDIKGNKIEIKKFTKEYVEEIIPEVFKWRNKVFGHFSFTDPYNEDNLGLLQHSIANPINWNGEHYIIGEIKYGIGNEMSTLPPRSLIEVYEKLIPRYFICE